MEDEHRVLVDSRDRLGNIDQIKALLKGGYAGPISYECFSPETHAMSDPLCCDQSFGHLMRDSFDNPYFQSGLPELQHMPKDDASNVAALLAKCPAHKATPLLNVPELAKQIGVAQLDLKDERERMGLGSFKALGAAYAIACEAA
ncbi:Diaminopropionate ammonia-lyase [Nymphon striatum]|nr:Diaminopropionate ammonia-lyase [Nymphon striatum]